MQGTRRTMLCTLLGLALPAAVTAQWRPEVQGREAAVVADHPLAAAAGMSVLRNGGNAVDAAITMAAVLAVVRPHMSGVGGDAFLLIREGRSGRIRALNGSGRAAAAADPAALRATGFISMPDSGLHAVTVPGAVRAWSDALRRHGSISLADALAPAIGYAEHGFAVSEKLAADIAAAAPRIRNDPAMRATFLPDGAAPVPGSLLRQPDLARSLQLIARDGAESIYTGDIGRRIAEFMHMNGAPLDLADLADHSSLWQEPVATNYAGYRVLAFPPNSQGIALLMQMNLAELYDLPAIGHNTARYVHTLVELKKLAFAERDRFITDPAFAEVPIDRMLSKSWARSLLSAFRADQPPATPADTTNRRSEGDGAGAGTTGNEGVGDGEGFGDREPVSDEVRDGHGDGDGDTVFIGAVDAEGNAVALIQSLYSAFGSGRMVPGTGIVLHNRGASFSLDAAHVNVLAPRKRPYHTLAPVMVLRRDNSLFMVLGSPGADGQTQTQLQVFNNIVLFGMTPQRAVEAARWRSYPDGRLLLEEALPADTRAELSGMGHPVSVRTGLTADLGGAQVILITSAGVRVVGADPRREAYGIAW